MSIKDEDWEKHFPKDAQDSRIIYQRLEKSGWIKKFRLDWSLPIEGFSANGDYNKWRSEFLIKATNHFLKSKKYNGMKKEMRKKKLQWANEKIAFSDIRAWGLKMQQQQPLFKFEYYISAIMTKLKIPQRYEAFVERCLILKEPPEWFPIERNMPRPELSYDLNTGRKRLFIETFADTKIKDFRSKLFRLEFKKLRAKLYDYGTIKQLGIPNLEMYETIYRWHSREGKGYKEIQRLLKRKFNRDMSEIDIGTCLTRYKKHIGIRTPKMQK